MSLRRFAHGVVRAVALLAVLALAFPGPASGTMPPLNGRSPDALIDAAHQGLFRVDPRPTGSHTLGTQLESGTWRVPVILVSFADDTLHYTAQDFDRLLFDTTRVNPKGSVAEYFAFCSGGRLKVRGRVVATVRLPETAAYYANASSGLLWYTTPRNELGFARDALKLCEQSIPWHEFDRDFDTYVDMVWFVHAGFGGESGNPNHLWSLTSHMSYGWANSSVFTTHVGAPGSSRYMLVDRFTVLPELSLIYPGERSEIGVFCHEFGHAIGLPDLYDVQNPVNTGPGNWSLMSSGAYGGDGHSPDLPVMMGAWPLRYLGWDRLVRPARDTTITLGALSESPDILDVWLQGADSPEHFMVERRARVGYDARLPGEGLILYHVNEFAMAVGLASNTVNSGPIPGLSLVAGDARDDLAAGRNRGDASDPLPGATGITRFDDFTTPSARSIANQYSNVGLEDITNVGTSTRMRVRVFPAGWEDPVDQTGAAYVPVFGRSPARAAGRDAADVGYVAASVYIDGRPQVVLRSSLQWDQPMQLSHSSTSALDPSLALLPGGDLAVVWSDARRGRSDIYYRVRIRGTWSTERAIVSLPGNCRSPSLANDARGGLYLAFQYQNADTLRLLFERFNYVFTTAQPVVVSDAPLRPENPVVVVSPDGTGSVLWHDRRTSGLIWAANFRPDTAVDVPRALVQRAGNSSIYSAALDAGGTLHMVWNIASSVQNELRYVTRPPQSVTPSEERILVSFSNPLDALTLDTDPQKAVHVAYGVSGTDGFALSYMRRWPDEFWDVGTTDLSRPGGFHGQQPTVVPRLDGNVDVAYTGDAGAGLRFMVRRRVLTPEPALAAEARPAASRSGRWSVGPNPARAGAALVARGVLADLTGHPALEVFDPAGRRLARAPIVARGAGWEAAIDPVTMSRWSPGIYFARLTESSLPPVRFVIVR